MVNALARAFRWRKPLETGVCGTIEEIAKAEKINQSYVKSSSAADSIGAIPRRVNSRWAATGGDDAGGADAAICGGVGRSAFPFARELVGPRCQLGPIIYNNKIGFGERSRNWRKATS